MKLKYLGTAAAERVPGMFCTCDVCQHARKFKGKDIRTQTQSLVDDGRLLIDFPGDAYLHLLQHDLDYSKIEHLLITHWHGDHLYAEDLAMRMSGYANGLDKPLHVYGGAVVKEFFDRAFELEGGVEEERVSFHLLEPYNAYEIAGYQVYVLPAQHGNFQEDCLIYVIRDQATGKTLFYTHDTGLLPEEPLAYLQEQQVKFDLVSLDCTGQGLPSSGAGHMSLAQNLQFIQDLQKFDLVSETTRYVANHFSHNGGLTHAQMEELAAQHGMLTAYDGMEVEF